MSTTNPILVSNNLSALNTDVAYLKERMNTVETKTSSKVLSGDDIFNVARCTAAGTTSVDDVSWQVFKLPSTVTIPELATKTFRLSFTMNYNEKEFEKVIYCFPEDAHFDETDFHINCKFIVNDVYSVGEGGAIFTPLVLFISFEQVEGPDVFYPKMTIAGNRTDVPVILNDVVFHEVSLIDLKTPDSSTLTYSAQMNLSMYNTFKHSTTEAEAWLGPIE